jgi:hypothetical protein
VPAAAEPSPAARPARAARAPRAAIEPEEVTGVVRPEREPGDTGRSFADAVLFLPRSAVELVLLTTGSASGLIEDEQLVPRAREIFFGQEGRFGVFPTLFLETGVNANVGARMVASGGPWATTLRAGYGGLDDNVIESRIRLALAGPLPAVVSVEGLHDRRSLLGFVGLGQDPFADGRNRYAGEPRAGLFRERRERGILALGVRAAPDLELLASTSYTQRLDDEPPGTGDAGIEHAFAPRSIDGPGRTTRIVYTEVSARIDTRESRRAVATGAMLEGYGGLAFGAFDEATRFGRTGGRAGVYLPVVRSTNVLSPRIALDSLVLPGGGAIPFREYTGQPTFRGFDSRRDVVSTVGSVDYRWQVIRFVAARLFADVARVAPDVPHLFSTDWRWAAGFGLDLHGNSTELGRLALAYSPEGINVLFSLGLPGPGFGDRQHRE